MASESEAHKGDVVIKLVITGLHGLGLHERCEALEAAVAGLLEL